MAKKAKWDKPKGSDMKSDKDATGKLHVDVPLSDDGKVIGSLTFSMTEDRVLRVEWKGKPGSEPLTGFEAWSNV